MVDLYSPAQLVQVANAEEVQKIKCIVYQFVFHSLGNV